MAAVLAKKKGPCFDELASFPRMEALAAEQGLRRACKTHREIYLSDTRWTEPARLRTILRFRLA